MAAPAVAAVAKKVIAYVVTDKKAMKVVGGIILGVRVSKTRFSFLYK